MKPLTDLSLWARLMVVSLAGLAAACNGNSSGDGGEDTTTVTGSVVAAPVDGASVRVLDSGGNVLAGPAVTAADGSYSLQIPTASLASDLVLESSGGSYDDEATGLTRAAGTLAAYVAGGSLSAGAQVHVTPASTIVHELVATHGMALADARAAFESAFGFAADTSEAPADATNPPAGASDAQLLAGLRAAAFSQLTMDLGLNADEQFDLLSALAEDLADGSLDGAGAGGAVTVVGATVLPADIQNRFSQALVGFHEGANDKTGLANDRIGVPPFARVALSDSYQVEYVPGMMAAMEGKTRFSLRITNRADGAPATGLSVSLMPMMHMAAMNHASPSDGCSEQPATPGEYACTVYYLMGSTMNGGMSMGYWQLKVMIGGMMGESVTFTPDVMMAMGGDTVKATLKGQADVIPGMMADDNRSYYLFKEALSGMTGQHTIGLFVAARESMMSFPAVSVGTVLNSGEGAYELTVASMSVEISTNPADPASWVAATDNGNGHWSASGITRLTDNEQGKFYVRLTVNGEQKTTDGKAPAGDGSNDYASFTVTPGGM